MTVDTDVDAEDYLKYSGMSQDEVLKEFHSSYAGLSHEEATQRLKQYGYNEPIKKEVRSFILNLLYKFTNPLIIILLFIGVFTLVYSEKISAIIIFGMILISILTEFLQEHTSEKEVEKLIELVRVKISVSRAGQKKEISIRELVPGDIIELSAGDLIPADVRILSSKDLFVNESSLTGESFPVQKNSESSSIKTSINRLSNIALMGTSVVSGTATAIIIKTGKSTEFSHIAKSIAKDNLQTSFDRGIRDFIWLMIKFILILTIFIFAINAIFKANIIQSLIFSLAVAVGLTPEMLPMLVTINLAKGAKAMSKKDVIVKHLDSIQNLGAMDILCTDKTGTLTEDKIILEKYCDIFGKENDAVLNYAYINSHFQSGLKNVLDNAILKNKHLHLDIINNYKKIDEIPFDFSRKVMSVVVQKSKKYQLVSKGAPEEIFARAKKYELNGRLHTINKKTIKDLYKEYDRLSADGFRVLAVAYRDVKKKDKYNYDDECDLIIKGYLAFFDPPKDTVKESIKSLKELGIEIKILTGDNELVTRKICNDVGINAEIIATGDQVNKWNDVELRRRVEIINIFTRLTPFQKERIIRALQENNHTVGFLGDGINDAPTLKRADVGISVNNGVDVAKESAGLILLNKNLMVLKEGVVEGRKVFSNLVKYIRMGSSSNFGNMFSVAIGSLFLPFLPMLPIQIILNNFLYDTSQLPLYSDRVDEEEIKKPRPWNISSIKNFMITIGPISSLYDLITFIILLWILKSPESTFQTMWFLESMFTQIFVIHIIRTSKIPFIQSRASMPVILASIIIPIIALIITCTPIGAIFGFTQLSSNQVLIVIAILIGYLITTFIVKNNLIKKAMID